MKIKNFIWAGDVNVRKVTTVAWHRVCTPLQDGGLGLRSISRINAVALYKLSWELASGSTQWALFLRAQFYKDLFNPRSFVKFSLWPGLRENLLSLQEQTRWHVGDGTSNNFWKSKWLSDSIVSML